MLTEKWDINHSVMITEQQDPGSKITCRFSQTFVSLVELFLVQFLSKAA